MQMTTWRFFIQMYFFCACKDPEPGQPNDFHYIPILFVWKQTWYIKNAFIVYYQAYSSRKNWKKTKTQDPYQIDLNACNVLILEMVYKHGVHS